MGSQVDGAALCRVLHDRLPGGRMSLSSSCLVCVRLYPAGGEAVASRRQPEVTGLRFFNVQLPAMAARHCL